MNLEIYKNVSDNNVINKNIGEKLYDLQVDLHDDCSLSNPSFILKYTNVNEIMSVQRANYCYFHNTGRYYYINDYVMMSGGRIRIDCKVDVLMSFKDYFVNKNFLITRTSQYNYRNVELVDTEIKLSNDKIVSFKEFENDVFIKGEFPNEYILTVCGGA